MLLSGPDRCTIVKISKNADWESPRAQQLHQLLREGAVHHAEQHGDCHTQTKQSNSAGWSVLLPAGCWIQPACWVTASEPNTLASSRLAAAGNASHAQLLHSLCACFGIPMLLAVVACACGPLSPLLPRRTLQIDLCLPDQAGPRLETSPGSEQPVCSRSSQWN